MSLWKIAQNVAQFIFGPNWYVTLKVEKEAQNYGPHTSVIFKIAQSKQSLHLVGHPANASAVFVFCLSYGFMNIQYRHRQTSQALALLNRFSSHVINVYISMKLKVPIGNPFRHIVWITKDICFWTTEMLNIVQNLTHMTRFFLQTSFLSLSNINIHLYLYVFFDGLNCWWQKWVRIPMQTCPQPQVPYLQNNVQKDWPAKSRQGIGW
jgi:hypothetical protein